MGDSGIQVSDLLAILCRVLWPIAVGSSSQNTKNNMGNCLSKVWKLFILEYQEQISDILSLVSRFEKKFLYGAQYNKLHSIKAYKPMVLDF